LTTQFAFNITELLLFSYSKLQTQKTAHTELVLELPGTLEDSRGQFPMLDAAS